MMTKIEIPSCAIEKISDQLLMITYREDYYVNLIDAVEIKESFEQLIPSGPIYTIICLQSKFLQVSQEAQKFLAQESPLIPRIQAAAMVLNALPSRLIIKFFINWFKPRYPSEVFKDRAEAEKWLKTKGL